jgi:hypothetical protein
MRSHARGAVSISAGLVTFESNSLREGGVFDTAGTDFRTIRLQEDIGG